MGDTDKRNERNPDLSERIESLELFLKFGELLADISSKFLSLSPDKVDEEITHALGRISRYFDVDHCAFLEVLEDCRDCRCLNKTGGQVPSYEAVSATSHPWAYHKLVDEKTPVTISLLDDLSPDAKIDRTSWEKENVLSILVTPLHTMSRVTHLIGLYSQRAGQYWSYVHIRRMNLLGNIFIQALRHKHDQELLTQLSQEQKVCNIL